MARAQHVLYTSTTFWSWNSCRIGCASPVVHQNRGQPKRSNFFAVWGWGRSCAAVGQQSSDSGLDHFAEMSRPGFRLGLCHVSELLHAHASNSFSDQSITKEVYERLLNEHETQTTKPEYMLPNSRCPAARSLSLCCCFFFSLFLSVYLLLFLFLSLSLSIKISMYAKNIYIYIQSMISSFLNK